MIVRKVSFYGQTVFGTKKNEAIVVKRIKPQNEADEFCSIIVKRIKSQNEADEFCSIIVKRIKSQNEADEASESPVSCCIKNGTHKRYSIFKKVSRKWE